ncbi:MAG: 50S ribosomal protein L17 [Desulfobacteraceae bacterium]|nr:50S ribosomal protein L17 [Desulfobacteraceae bacterium]
MRHRKAGIKLNRTSSHRQAMFRNMVTSLFKYDRIKTTDAKAKELRKWADHIVTLAKKGDLHARRQALSILREKKVVHKIFEEVPDRFRTVSGGYTRIIKIGCRPGDAAQISMIELVTPEPDTKKTKKEKTVSKKATASDSKKVTKKADTSASGAAKSAAKPKTKQADSDGSGTAKSAVKAKPKKADSGDADAAKGTAKAKPKKADSGDADAAKGTAKTKPKKAVSGDPDAAKSTARSKSRKTDSVGTEDSAGSKKSAKEKAIPAAEEKTPENKEK